MGDLIDRDKLLEDMTKNDELFSMDVRRVILEQPVVEAVPVVRCKDCKYWHQGDCYRLELSRPHDFAAMGRRKGKRNEAVQGV